MELGDECTLWVPQYKGVVKVRNPPGRCFGAPPVAPGPASRRNSSRTSKVVVIISGETHSTVECKPEEDYVSYSFSVVNVNLEEPGGGSGSVPKRAGPVLGHPRLGWPT